MGLDKYLKRLKIDSPKQFIPGCSKRHPFLHRSIKQGSYRHNYSKGVLRNTLYDIYINEELEYIIVNILRHAGILS